MKMFPTRQSLVLLVHPRRRVAQEPGGLPALRVAVRGSRRTWIHFIAMLTLGVLAAPSASGQAQSPDELLVLPFGDVSRSDIDPETLAELTGLMRRQLGALLGESCAVLDSDAASQRLRHHTRELAQCRVNCGLLRARLAGATYVIEGNIIRVSGRYHIRFTLNATASGELVALLDEETMNQREIRPVVLDAALQLSKRLAPDLPQDSSQTPKDGGGSTTAAVEEHEPPPSVEVLSVFSLEVGLGPLFCGSGQEVYCALLAPGAYGRVAAVIRVWDHLSVDIDLTVGGLARGFVTDSHAAHWGIVASAGLLGHFDWRELRFMAGVGIGFGYNAWLELEIGDSEFDKIDWTGLVVRVPAAVFYRVSRTISVGVDFAFLAKVYGETCEPGLFGERCDTDPDDALPHWARFGVTMAFSL